MCTITDLTTKNIAAEICHPNVCRTFRKAMIFKNWGLMEKLGIILTEGNAER